MRPPKSPPIVFVPPPKIFSQKFLVFLYLFRSFTPLSAAYNKDVFIIVWSALIFILVDKFFDFSILQKVTNQPTALFTLINLPLIPYSTPTYGLPKKMLEKLRSTGLDDGKLWILIRKSEASKKSSSNLSNHDNEFPVKSDFLPPAGEAGSNGGD